MEVPFTVLFKDGKEEEFVVSTIQEQHDSVPECWHNLIRQLAFDNRISEVESIRINERGST